MDEANSDNNYNLNELTDVEKETIKIIQQRNLKGRETYGKGLDHNDNYNWIDMAIEEAADLLKYLVAEKLKRTGKI